MKWHLPIAPHIEVKTVPKAGGKGWKKPDINSAIKYCLLPSVTSVIDLGEEGLVRWQIGQAIFRCAILPYRGEFDDEHKINQEDYKEYEREILGQMEEHVGGFADHGKDVHANLERYFEGKSWEGEVTQNLIEVLTPRLKELGVVKVVPETPLGGIEYGVLGRPDLVGFDKDGKLIWIGDLKNKGLGEFKRNASEASLGANYKLQLGGYAWLLRKQHPADRIQLDQILSCRDNNDAKYVPYEDSERWEKAFDLHLNSWFYRKNHFPHLLWEGQKDGLMDELKEIEEQNKWSV